MLGQQAELGKVTREARKSRATRGDREKKWKNIDRSLPESKRARTKRTTAATIRPFGTTGSKFAP